MPFLVCDVEITIIYISQFVDIVNTKNGKKARGKVVDSCPGCSDNDLGMFILSIRPQSGLIKNLLADLSPALFQQLDQLSVGVIPISWHFVPRFQPEELEDELDSE